jgi:hypothetical protein
MSPVTPQHHWQGDSSTASALPFHIASGQTTSDGNARAIRRAVLARLTATERALLWRWRIGVTAIYGGLFAVLLAILVLVTRASPSSP